MLQAMRSAYFLALFALVPVGIFASCASTQTAVARDAGGAGDASVDSKTGVDRELLPEVAPPPFDGKVAPLFCDLPGSLVFQKSGNVIIAGGNGAAPSLSWLTLPAGFCLHYFAHVNLTRQMRFAPGGELFVASPSTPTAGGAGSVPGTGGLGAIVVLADDNHDGYADGDVFPHSDGSQQSLSLFENGLASTQGMMFAPGYFYYEDTVPGDMNVGAGIKRIPYKSGQRVASGTPELIANITVYPSTVHWPKTLDMADDGTIFVGNGGDQYQVCNADVFPRPFTGGILSIGGATDPVGGTPIAEGFRNPIAVRCQHGHDLCFSTELALDGSGGSGGREKLVAIHKGDDWGFPCCATANMAYPEVSGTPNCSHVATEPVSFVIGDTPFGLDFEPGLWPEPYKNDIFVALHGAVGSWIGARVVAIPTQANGMPVTTSDLGPTNMTSFATGWDDGLLDPQQGRPAAIEFASDGRVFIGNDVSGDIFWIAPVGLKTNW